MKLANTARPHQPQTGSPGLSLCELARLCGVVVLISNHLLHSVVEVVRISKYSINLVSVQISLKGEKGHRRREGGGRCG